MCYALSHRKWKSYDRAKRGGASAEELAELYREYLDSYFEELQEREDNKAYKQGDFHHVSGFEHPNITAITNDEEVVQDLEWGLIPFWCKDELLATKMSNSCLNARGESIYSKPAFRDSAKKKHCLILAECFFEYHHANGKKYPFLIKRKDGEPIIMAGLWDEWINKDTGEIKKTFAIVTIEANPMMAAIHNNPRASGPRMPVIFTKDEAVKWMIETEGMYPKEQHQQQLIPFNENEMKAFTVTKLIGKDGAGNTVAAQKPFRYDDLESPV